MKARGRDLGVADPRMVIEIMKWEDTGVDSEISGFVSTSDETRLQALLTKEGLRTFNFTLGSDLGTFHLKVSEVAKLLTIDPNYISSIYLSTKLRLS